MAIGDDLTTAMGFVLLLSPPVSTADPSADETSICDGGLTPVGFFVNTNRSCACELPSSVDEFSLSFSVSFSGPFDTDDTDAEDGDSSNLTDFCRIGEFFRSDSGA